MISVVKVILAAWPYWVPVLTFFFGIIMGVVIQEDKSREQLCRLTEQIHIPDKWRYGVVDILLDGSPADKPTMPNAGLLIRSACGHGSGVCISSEGIVLTNAHVVGEEPVVEVQDSQGSYLGRVIKRCEKRDVALIRLAGSASIVAAICNNSPSVGDDLYVSGAPWSVENKSLLTRGVVSKHATIEDLPYIYTDASIAPGNSGGPVFNSLGRLVGITVAIQCTSDNKVTDIGLVIPIREALKAMKVKSRTATNDSPLSTSKKKVAYSR